MDHAIQGSRERNLLQQLPRDASLQILDLVDRYHATGDALEKFGRLIGALKIEPYWGDYGL
jgi:hypothetical protein